MLKVVEKQEARSCRRFVPEYASPMESKSILRNVLLRQLTINLGKPPDHDRSIHNIGQ